MSEPRQIDALTRHCPKCGAKAGDPCTVWYGDPGEYGPRYGQAKRYAHFDRYAPGDEPDDEDDE